jgi:ribonuclease-3
MLKSKRSSALAELAALQKRLKIRFKNKAVLEQALVHSSYVNENPGIAPGDNERLEFLGDAVLGFVIARELYQRFPDLSEGEMTRVRSSLVSQEPLARMAKSIKLGDYLYMGRGEEASGGREKPANLARALEALVAAIFLDRGLNVAKKFILKLAEKGLKAGPSRGVEADYKSKLQEVMQARRQRKPKYRVVEASGPAHDRRFTVEVMVADDILGRGSGKSKKAAETEAARNALDRLPDHFTA